MELLTDSPSTQISEALRLASLRASRGARLHVHLVTNGWIDVNEARVMAQKPQSAEDMMLEAVQADAITFFPVGRGVSHFRNDGPDLIERVSIDIQTSLFLRLLSCWPILKAS
jgi:hypothetical protein